MRVKAQVMIPDVPPSLNELKGLHPMEHHKRTKPIKELAWLMAQDARNRAGWPLPVRTSPPTKRWVAVTVHRARLLDPLDNLPGSVKPCLDALKGVLLVDDSPDWLGLIGVRQMPCQGATQRTIIDVWLTAPPPEEIELFAPRTEVTA